MGIHHNLGSASTTVAAFSKEHGILKLWRVRYPELFALEMRIEGGPPQTKGIGPAIYSHEETDLLACSLWRFFTYRTVGRRIR